MAIIKRHWLSLSAGVLNATVVAVCSSVWLVRLLTLPESIQRSLVMLLSGVVTVVLAPLIGHLMCTIPA